MANPNLMRSWLLFLVVFCSGLSAIWAQEQPPEAPFESPYEAMYNHLYYLQEESYQPALSARSLAQAGDSIRATELAIKLKQILDGKGLFVRWQDVPRDTAYLDSMGRTQYVPFPFQLEEIYLERVDGQWRYAANTVDRIADLHRKVYPLGADVLVQFMPRLGQQRFLGLYLWQYLGLVLLLLAAFLVHLLFTLVLRPLLSRLSQSKIYPSLVPRAQVVKLARYFSVFLVLRLLLVGLPSLQLPPAANEFALQTIQVLTALMVVLVLLKVLDILMIYARRFAQRTTNKLDEQLLPILKGVVQVLIIGGGIIQVLRMFSIDVTALIAGISIGSLAIALAAKDTVSNLFGSVTVFLDQPFQIGDWIHFDGVDGMVEEVGVRSTRVRTFANSLVYIPNGVLANMTINNYGLRSYRRFNTVLSITYDTPPELIETFVAGLREIVAHHPRTRKDFYEIHLNSFSSSSLDILFYIFFDVPTWSEELKGRQEIMLAILRLARELGVRFAFPTSTVHVENLPGQESLSPEYATGLEERRARLSKFLTDYRKGKNGADGGQKRS